MVVSSIGQCVDGARVSSGRELDVGLTHVGNPVYTKVYDVGPSLRSNCSFSASDCERRHWEGLPAGQESTTNIALCGTPTRNVVQHFCNAIPDLPA